MVRAGSVLSAFIQVMPGNGTNSQDLQWSC